MWEPRRLQQRHQRLGEQRSLPRVGRWQHTLHVVMVTRHTLRHGCHLLRQRPASCRTQHTPSGALWRRQEQGQAHAQHATTLGRAGVDAGQRWQRAEGVDVQEVGEAHVVHDASPHVRRGHVTVVVWQHPCGRLRQRRSVGVTRCRAGFRQRQLRDPRQGIPHQLLQQQPQPPHAVRDLRWAGDRLCLGSSGFGLHLAAARRC